MVTYVQSRYIKVTSFTVNDKYHSFTLGSLVSHMYRYITQCIRLSGEYALYAVKNLGTRLNIYQHIGLIIVRV